MYFTVNDFVKFWYLITESVLLIACTLYSTWFCLSLISYHRKCTTYSKYIINVHCTLYTVHCTVHDFVLSLKSYHRNGTTGFRKCLINVPWLIDWFHSFFCVWYLISTRVQLIASYLAMYVVQYLCFCLTFFSQHCTLQAQATQVFCEWTVQ